MRIVFEISFLVYTWLKKKLPGLSTVKGVKKSQATFFSTHCKQFYMLKRLATLCYSQYEKQTSSLLEANDERLSSAFDDFDKRRQQNN